MQIKVSIIVPVYNVEQYLKRCLDSLINQTMKEIEIILVDDGSSDRCPVICDEYAKYDSRIKVIHKKNEGLGYARNSGLDVVSGEYIAFVDSDDYVANTMYEKLYKKAKSNNADIVLCDFYKKKGEKITWIKDKGKKVVCNKAEINDYLLDMIGAKPYYKKDYVHEMMVWHGIYSKSIIDENNIRFCSERQYISEDIMFHIDIIPKANVICEINEPLYYYCYNNSSLSRQYNDERFKKDLDLYYEINRKLSKFLDYKSYYLSIERFLIARVRTNILHIVSCSSVDKKERKNKILEIINNKEIRKICKAYPINQLPLQQKLFLKAIREQQYYNILILAKARTLLI